MASLCDTKQLVRFVFFEFNAKVAMQCMMTIFLGLIVNCCEWSGYRSGSPQLQSSLMKYSIWCVVKKELRNP